jgi:pimeloyl-ACP methyl ester carboxylesterase
VIDPAVGELMVDEFRRIYATAGARYAFLSSARNIYLEPPFGEHGFYPRLSKLAVPALFVWADHDTVVPCAFARHVARWLPSAEQVTLERCGHVPQVERPEETNELLMSFFARVASGEEPPTTRSGRNKRRRSQAA